MYLWRSLHLSLEENPKLYVFCAYIMLSSKIKYKYIYFLNLLNSFIIYCTLLHFIYTFKHVILIRLFNFSRLQLIILSSPMRCVIVHFLALLTARDPHILDYNSNEFALLFPQVFDLLRRMWKFHISKLKLRQTNTRFLCYEPEPQSRGAPPGWQTDILQMFPKTQSSGQLISWKVTCDAPHLSHCSPWPLQNVNARALKCCKLDFAICRNDIANWLLIM